MQKHMPLAPQPVSLATSQRPEEQPDIHSSSDQYALRFAGPAGRYLLDRQRLALTTLLGFMGSAPLNVLDVGGGHLQTAEVLAAAGHAVIVHGSAPQCFLRLPALAARYPGRITQRVGPLSALPAADGEFDLVIGIRMLGHVNRWRELLAEMHRASRRWIVVEFASASGVQHLARPLFGLKKRVEGNTRHFRTYALDNVVSALRHTGARTTRIERQFVLPIALHRVLRRPALSEAAEAALARAGLAARIGSPVLLLAEREDAPTA